ncbi:MAG: hypothetical protein ACTHJW_09885 [Streptosporangiaceae bacterium]
MGTMIRVSVYLFGAQWALLGALGLLVVIMYRQLGRLLTGSDKAADLGPEVGAPAAAITYVTMGDQQERRFSPGDDGPALVAFADPTCPSCEQLVAVLGELTSAGELDGIRTLVLMSDPPSYVQISDVFSASELEIGRPARRNGLDSYRVSGTPLLVAIDASGVVRAAGSVIKAAEILAFAQACFLPARKAALAIVAAERASGGHDPATRAPADTSTGGA